MPYDGYGNWVDDYSGYDYGYDDRDYDAGGYGYNSGYDYGYDNRDFGSGYDAGADYGYYDPYQSDYINFTSGGTPSPTTRAGAPSGGGGGGGLSGLLSGAGDLFRDIAPWASAAGGAGLMAYGLNQEIPDITMPPWEVPLDPTATGLLGAGTAPMPTDIGGYNWQDFVGAGAAPLSTNIGGYDWTQFMGAGAAPVRNDEWNQQFGQAMAWPGAEQIMGQIEAGQSIPWQMGLGAAGGVAGAGDAFFGAAAGMLGGAGQAGQESGYAAPDLYRGEEAEMIARMMTELREDPGMAIRHASARQQMADRLRNELGPGFESSTAGIRAMTELERRIDDELFAREKGDIEMAQKSGQLIGQLAGSRASSATQAAQVRSQAAQAAAGEANRAAAIYAQMGASKAQAAAAGAQAYNQALANQSQSAWTGLNAMNSLQQTYGNQQMAGLNALSNIGQTDRAAAQWGLGQLSTIGQQDRTAAQWGMGALGDVAGFNQKGAQWGFGQYQGAGDAYRKQQLEIQAANIKRMQGDKMGILNLAGTLMGAGYGGVMGGGGQKRD